MARTVAGAPPPPRRSARGRDDRVCAALVLAFGGDLEGATTIFREVHDRFQAADDAPGQGGALTTWGLAEEPQEISKRAAELLTAGADDVGAAPERAHARLGPPERADTLLAAGRGDERAAELAARNGSSPRPARREASRSASPIRLLRARKDAAKEAPPRVGRSTTR